METVEFWQSLEKYATQNMIFLPHYTWGENIKMTQNIDLNTMTTDEEIIAEYRKDLDIQIKQLFVKALPSLGSITESIKAFDKRCYQLSKHF